MTIPQAPPTRLETWLSSLPNDQLGALFIAVFVLLPFAVCMAVSIWHIVRMERDAKPSIPAPRQPVSSNRKAARR